MYELCVVSALVGRRWKEKADIWTNGGKREGGKGGERRKSERWRETSMPCLEARGEEPSRITEVTNNSLWATGSL